MSEVQSRPVASRGRGSARGGRGGFSSKGGRGGRGGGHATTNGEQTHEPHTTSIDDDSEVGQLKKKYGSKIDTIKDFFPHWTDEDAVMALEETDGDLGSTLEQITTGTITQWGEVSNNKKDKLKAKAKEAPALLTDVVNNRISRGDRGTSDSTRGNRGRGSDRGGRANGRGGRGVAHTNGSRSKESHPVATEDFWDTAKPETADSNPTGEDIWGGPSSTTVASVVEPVTSTISSIIPDGVKKSWASLLHQEPKKAPAPVEKPVEDTKPAEPVETVEMPERALDPVPIDESILESLPEPETDITPVAMPSDQPEPIITPSKDALTETNLEQILDTSQPAPTATAASTAASSWDPRSSSFPPAPPQAVRVPSSGFAATAQKATAVGARSASFQRRVLDQEEAVRMPGNREVDRTSVQFGAFNLNGSGDEDIDGDREEPETRAQPPLHSPVAPRASLPPAPPQPQVSVAEAQPSSLTHARPPVPVVSAPGVSSPQALPNVQVTSQQGPQGSHAYPQYGQYGSAGTQQEQHTQKYEPFAQQAPTSQSPFEGHPSHQTQSQAPPQQPQSVFATAPGEYSQYYPSEQNRNNYQSYYGGAPYSQQSGNLSQQDGAPGLQQRTASGFNGTQNDTASQYPPSSAPQTQSRYATAGEPQTSGHSTPNPVTQAQQQQSGPIAPSQSQHQPQSQAGGYQYSHPSFYNSPYYTQYNNQYQGYGQGAYGGAPYGNKGGIYSQPHAGYGVSPQTPYDHAASPAAGTFGQASLHGRDNAVGGSLGDYGRGAASAQTSTPQGIAGSGTAFGMPDTFARHSSYQGQNHNQHYGQQPSQPNVDELKPFGDSKSTNGPSPSLSQANRPTSAANNGLGQSTLPPPQGSQQGYGGYPNHLQQHHALHGSQNNSQYGGLGGHQAAVGQSHQASTYAQYPGGFGGSYYGGNGQQQRGGWGGNYGH